MRRSVGLLCILFLLAVAPLPAAWSQPTGFEMAPMWDGTKLRTDYYLPEGQPGPFPAILVRSTYGRLSKDNVKDFLERGYACVIQDLRGFGDSEGEKNVFYTDGWREGLMDAADTVDWVKRQPWCNGKVGTYGASALGITQDLAAPSTTGINCQSIVVGTSKFYGILSYQGGVWRKALCEGWLTMLKLQNTMELWKSHPSCDEFWSYFDTEAKASRITAPALHVGGWYDIFQQGTINAFVSRQKKGGKGAKGNQRLIMLPGAHGPYHADAALKLPKGFDDVRVSHHERAFLDYWLKGEDTGITALSPVFYYTMGDDTNPDAPGMEWRAAETWPPFPTKPTSYYLAEGGVLTTGEPGEASQPGAFTYDPANPFPTHGGQNLILPAGPFDQRKVNEGRTDLLKFASAPLAAPMEITGRVAVQLFVSTDAPDTDFTAKLIDIYPEPDGREILMLDNIQRVKYRKGFEKPAALLKSPDEVVEITIDLWSISWVFNTGHRIGLQVSSSNYPRFEKNPNSGDDWPTDSNLRVAHNVVHMGKAHPSALVLPVRPEGQKVAVATCLNPEDVKDASKGKRGSEGAR